MSEAKVPARQEVETIEPNSTALMRLIEKATLQPDFDVAKLEKLLDVKERWEATEARKAFVAAKAAFKADAPNITKNRSVGYESRRTGDRTDYDFASLDYIAETLTPVLAKHGLSYSWETEQLDTAAVRVTCVLSHVMGHSERVTLQAMPDDSGKKNLIQAIGSTVTYLERYTLLAATGIATKEQDDDGVKGGKALINDDQSEALMKLVTEVGADRDAFLKYMGVEAFSDIPAKLYKDAVKALERKRKTGAKK